MSGPQKWKAWNDHSDGRKRVQLQIGVGCTYGAHIHVGRDNSEDDSEERHASRSDAWSNQQQGTYHTERGHADAASSSGGNYHSQQHVDCRVAEMTKQLREETGTSG